MSRSSRLIRPLERNERSCDHSQANDGLSDSPGPVSVDDKAVDPISSARRVRYYYEHLLCTNVVKGQ
jgi:hypothetical protein